MFQPKLRFKYFHDKWTLCPFKILAKRISKHISRPGLPRISFDDINSGLGSLKKIDKNTKSGIGFKSGDVLFGKLRPYLKNWILVHFDGIATGDFWVLRSKCNTFLYAFIQTEKYNYISNITSGTKMPRSDWKLVSNYKFNIPSLPEQKLIGKFFAKLDKLIQLQQKKVVLLKKLKRGYLQKLFPQPGTCFPSLRFKGFFKPWSCSKASTLFKSISEKNHPKLPVLSSTQTKGLVYRKDLNSDIKYNPKSLPNYKVIHKGDFVISLRSFQGGFECSNKLGIISAAYTVFNFINRFNQNTYFWKIFFKSYVFLQLLKKITFGIRDGKSIKFTGFKSLKLKYPSYKEECKLGKLFKNMNNNIDIQKNKLTHLRKLKKAYLQKMFC